MSGVKHAIGIDISTQTITAALIGVEEDGGVPRGLTISGAWAASRPCRDEADRKNPSVWLGLIRECIADLKRNAPEAEQAVAIGISTTFPGIFAIPRGGVIDPSLVSLYDNTDDSGICGGDYEEALGAAEAETLNRMWPGNMALGLVRLIKTCGLRLKETSALVPPNTAFSFELLRAVGHAPDPAALFSDFTETLIGGLYDARTAQPAPPNVARLLELAVPGIDSALVRELLPRAVPSWRNTVPTEALPAVRNLLGLPNLTAVSIGAGDSPLGTLALFPGPDAALNIRGSSDSPVIAIDVPKPHTQPRETVLHYPLPTVTSASDSPWCVVAPMLRSGKVWDWVRRLRFSDGDLNADFELEKLAREALNRRLASHEPPLRFDTALGGERAPGWDPHETGTLAGLVEAHDIGDIALAALEGMSERLRQCLELMESRYEVKTSTLLLAGGPVRNALWNWVTQVITEKRTLATTFSDASLLGAAMLGYAASYDGAEDDSSISLRLRKLSRLAAERPLIRPAPVTDPTA